MKSFVRELQPSSRRELCYNASQKQLFVLGAIANTTRTAKFTENICQLGENRIKPSWELLATLPLLCTCIWRRNLTALLHCLKWLQNVLFFVLIWMRLLGTIFIHCECEETKAKINARHARTSPIKASRKHDSSSGRKGTNISILPSRIAISAVMMSLPLPCFAKKTLLLVVIDSSLRNRTKVGSQSDIRYVLCYATPESLELMHVWFSLSLTPP